MSTASAGTPDCTNNDNDDKQEQAEAEQAHDYASVREAWEAREAEAAVDEARRETSPLELRKDRDVIANLSQLVQKYFANVKGLRMETEDVLYQAAVTIAVTLGYTEDHISVPPTKYEFLEDMASMLEQQEASPIVIDMLLQTTAKRPDFYPFFEN